MNERKTLTGEAVNRIDGILKVTGTASYTTDFPIKNVACGFLIKSETAAGKILEIDQTAAEKAPGVLAIVTHKNAPKLASARSVRGGAMLQTPDVNFWAKTSVSWSLKLSSRRVMRQG